MTRTLAATLLLISLVPSLAADSLERLAADYKLAIEIARKPIHQALSRRPLTARPASPAALRRYQPLLLTEWRYYPKPLIRRSRLRRLVLCSGLAWGGQRRQAVPDFAGNALYLDVSHRSEAYLRHVLHHEFFHVIDYADDGQVYRDASWLKLNPPSFRYGRGGQFVRQSSAAACTHPRAGFLNAYQMSGVEEDKAELFAYLLQRHRVALGFIAGDERLQRKVAHLKQLLARFCPQLDRSYWQAVARRRKR